MSSTVFKRLFEVRIIQTYYLDFVQVSGLAPKPFLDRSTQDKAIVLAAEITGGRYDIRRDMTIEPTLATTKLLKGMGLKWALGPLGLVVGLEVAAVADRYKPKKVLLPGTHCTFLLRAKQPEWPNFTNHILRPTLPSRYYFNNGPGTGKSMPSLSVQPPTVNPGRTWEMGALGMNGGNLIMLNKTTGDASNAAAQMMLPNHQWANSADRTVLPKQFHYHFDPLHYPVDKAVFSLVNTLGDTKRVITHDFGGQAPKDVALDFATFPASLPGAKPPPSPDGQYTLKVLVNDTHTDSHTIHLRSDLPNDNNVLGMIDISLNESGDFRLLNPDGTLRGDWQNTPTRRWISEAVFEIRFLPRYTYSQYRFESNISDINPSPGAYQLDGNQLRFNQPRPLLHTRRSVSISIKGGTTKDMPDPEKSLKYLPDFTDTTAQVFVSEIMLRSP